MAGRKQKRSVEYFPHFVESGKTLFTLEKMFGNDGYSTPFKTLELLAGSDDHFCDFSQEEDWLYICAKLNLDEEKAQKILTMMAKLDFIDKALFENKIIWCQNLVENLRPVYEKRRSELPSPPKTGAEIPKTGAEIQQSKVKGSKEKKSIKSTVENPPVFNGSASDVFAYWKTELNHPRAKLDDKRKKKINAILKIGYTVEDLKTAIDGCKQSPWHQGQNERQSVYDDIELICRDASHVDRFIKTACQDIQSNALSEHGRRAVSVAKSWLEKRNG